MTDKVKEIRIKVSNIKLVNDYDDSKEKVVIWPNGMDELVVYDYLSYLLTKLDTANEETKRWLAWEKELFVKLDTAKQELEKIRGDYDKRNV